MFSVGPFLFPLSRIGLFAGVVFTLGSERQQGFEARRRFHDCRLDYGLLTLLRVEFVASSLISGMSVF